MTEAKCPVDHSAFTRHAVEANAGLRDVFGPLSSTVEQAVDTQLASGDILPDSPISPITEIPTDILLIKYKIGVAPKDLGFGDVDREKWPKLFTGYGPGDQSIAYGDDLLGYCQSSGLNNLGMEYDTDIVAKGFDFLTSYGDEVASRSLYEQQRIQEVHTLRSRNVLKSHLNFGPTAALETFLHAKNLAIPDNLVTANLVVPVGAYGEDFAQELIKSTARLQATAQEALRPEVGKVTEANQELLHRHTARAAHEASATEDSTMLTVQEGILSIMQTITLLTAEKVEGYDDPLKLAKDVVASGLVERLARFSPMGFVGPMILKGNYFPGAIEKSDDGLRFSDAFEAYLKASKEKYLGYVAIQNEAIESGNAGQNEDAELLGRVCPLSDRNGGVRKLSEKLISLLEANSL